MDSRVPENFDEEAMAAARSTDRDSLFMQAHLTITGISDPVTVRVRNLSSGGMLAEGKANVAAGMAVTADLRNVGAVEGRIVWAGEGKFGIAFDRPINPQSVRRQVVVNDSLPTTLSGLGMSRAPFRRR